MEIKKLLVANRGEIAVRIIKAAQEMGISVVVVYSKLDENQIYVQRASEKEYLPGDSLAETYLNIDAIIKAAKQTGANAIHPGYGFLSENPLFAEACEREGIEFVGPSSKSIRMIGNKIAARELAKQNNIPITAGVTGTPAELLRDHALVGFPMLIKAAAGGGGKGMRIVRSEGELESALVSTSSEAASYFGDSTVYIERFIENPRHIEVQVLGDKHGNMIHLYERECSVQRRHQKIIEEAPSPTLTSDVRQKICTAAVNLASSIGYYSAGTMEFLVDDDLNFYFLEMNTRIQVEHPVTEMITGIDIVKQQLLIAQDNKLGLSQEKVTISGHAIEVRVYAEDPANNFMPSPGYIRNYTEPEISRLRIDSPGFERTTFIHSEYDPMISKVISHSNTREQAINNLVEELQYYFIHGIKTNLTFLLGLLQHPDFISNNIHTRYIDNRLDEINVSIVKLKDSLDPVIPLIAGLMYSFGYNGDIIEGEKHKYNPIGYWRISNKMKLLLDKKPFDIQILDLKWNNIEYILDGKQGTAHLSMNQKYTLRCNGLSYQLFMGENRDGSVEINYHGHLFLFERPDLGVPDDLSFEPVMQKSNDVGDIKSPMPGKVIKVSVGEGQVVSKGALLMVIEAMKMENNIYSPCDAKVDRLMVKQGDSVDATSHLIHITKIE